MGLVFIIHPFGDFLYGKICFFQHFTGLIHPHAGDEALRGHAGIFLEDAVDLGGVQPHVVCQVFDCDPGADIPPDIDNGVVKAGKADDVRFFLFFFLMQFYQPAGEQVEICLLYTSDAADE